MLSRTHCTVCMHRADSDGRALTCDCVSVRETPLSGLRATSREWSCSTCSMAGVESRHGTIAHHTTSHHITSHHIRECHSGQKMRQCRWDSHLRKQPCKHGAVCTHSLCNSPSRDTLDRRKIFFFFLISTLMSIVAVYSSSSVGLT